MKHIKNILIMFSTALILTLFAGAIFSFMTYIKEWTYSFPTFIGFTIFASPMILFITGITYFIILWLDGDI